MISVSASGLAVVEGDTGYNSLTFSIILDDTPSEAITVPWRISLGSAILGQDTNYYSANYLTGTSTFYAGQTLKEVTVYPSGDFDAEDDESFILELLAPTNAKLDGGQVTYQATGWVYDDDGTSNPLSLHVSDPIVIEGNRGSQRVSFTLSLSRPADQTYKIGYSLEGSDQGSDRIEGSNSVTFTAGQSEATVSFNLPGNKIAEGLEYVDLKLDIPRGISEASGGQATILDNDGLQKGPYVLVSDARVSEEDTSYGPLVFSVILSEPTSEAVTVPWRLGDGTATLGEDTNYYTGGYASGSLTFYAGQVQKTVTVYPSGDYDAEFDETFIVEILEPENAQLPGGATIQQGIGWVLDDDGTSNPTVLQVTDVTVEEGDRHDTTASVRLELSRPATRDLAIDYRTVNGSAKAGKDFKSVSGTVEIKEGQSSASLGIEIFGDVVAESKETFSLQFFLPNSIRKVSGGVITILNEDVNTTRHTEYGDNSGNKIIGTGNPDFLVGRAGADEIFGRGNNDKLFGDAGNDTLRGDLGNDRLEGGDGKDRLEGGNGSDRIFGDEGDDLLLGGGNRDVLSGGAGADTISGNSGSDDLSGDEGTDVLVGGGGNDRLEGGAGNDKLTGGSGEDAFIFGRHDGVDIIRDWNDRHDYIDVNGIKRFGNIDIYQRGENAIIEFADTKIVLLDTDSDNLSREDFLL